MWAMIPMLRTLPRSVSTSRATRFLFPSVVAAGPAAGVLRIGRGPGWFAPGRPRRSPAVVRERLVRLRHLVGVLAALDRGTEAVRSVEQLVGEPLDHRLLTACPGVRDEPAQAERGRAAGADLDRHLVGRATDAAAADLEGRLHVVERTLQRDDRVGAVALPAA